MKNAHAIDEARLGIMLNELRLPTIKTLWPQFAEQADREGWPAARFLSAIAEHELAERANRRIERHLAEAHLPPGKTLDSFAFDAVPMISKAQVMAITAGDSWLAKGANILMFGPPGGGKSHLAAAIGLALIENGWRVLFTRTTDLVQKLERSCWVTLSYGPESTPKTTMHPAERCFEKLSIEAPAAIRQLH